ncbi:MAG: hypothetical protein Q8O48_12285 [Anaerolineales bacterium]|nr:hypothetical protein [Anaerolineales bacterium]
MLKLYVPASSGALLAETFYQAGIRLIETGPIQNAEKKRSTAEWENEWALIEVDLVDSIPGEDIQKRFWTNRLAGEAAAFSHPNFFEWGKS